VVGWIHCGGRRTITAVALGARLLMLMRERPFNSPDIVRFLKHLLSHIPDNPLVIWDDAPIHRGQPVKDVMAHGGARRIQLEPLPGYAPDLNPDEGIWNISSVSNSATSAVRPSTTSDTSFASPSLASVTNPPSFTAAFAKVAMPFRFLCGDQYYDARSPHADSGSSGDELWMSNALAILRGALVAKRYTSTLGHSPLCTKTTSR
jgi:hypothetical protein